MRQYLPLVIVVAVVAVLALFFAQAQENAPITAEETMRVRTSVFQDGGPMQHQQTCDGGDVRPPLALEAVPEGARSLAVVVEDPDASSGPFTHWLAWNIAPDVPSIRSDVLPDGTVEGTNDFDVVGWRGPCPPAGETHHYVFTVYALNTTLALPSGAGKRQLLDALEGHVLAQGVLTGTYARVQ